MPYPESIGEHDTQRGPALDVPYRQYLVPSADGRQVYLSFAYLGSSGIIRYSVCRMQAGTGPACAGPPSYHTSCPDQFSGLACAIDFVLFGGTFSTLAQCGANGDYGCYGLALLQAGLSAVSVGQLGSVGGASVLVDKAAAQESVNGLLPQISDTEINVLVSTSDRTILLTSAERQELKEALATGAAGCGCFPGDTGVATPHGLVSIAHLHVGDQVLAENPVGGKVEPEQVRAVIDDGAKPVMAVGLSDGSSLEVTTNHPFYVDSGPAITHAQWVQAGDLRVGDRLRTEYGRDVTVVRLRYHIGYAHVYTLTVANDHDFLVGAADVLVHNCDLYNGGIKLTQKQSVNLRRAAQRIWERTALFRASGRGWQIHHRIPLEYSNLFATSYDPNRLSNLVAMPIDARTAIERDWTTWRVQNPSPSAAAVMRQAQLLDQRYGRSMHYLSGN